MLDNHRHASLFSLRDRPRFRPALAVNVKNVRLDFGKVLAKIFRRNHPDIHTKGADGGLAPDSLVNGSGGDRDIELVPVEIFEEGVDSLLGATEPDMVCEMDDFYFSHGNLDSFEDFSARRPESPVIFETEDRLWDSWIAEEGRGSDNGLALGVIEYQGASARFLLCNRVL